MISRRAVLKRGLLVAGVPLLGLSGAAIFLDRKFNPHTPLHYPWPERGDEGLRATPECLDHDHRETDSVTEGPFYKPDTPERRVLRDPTTVGTPLLLRGRVLTPNCSPLAGAVIDVWSCDGHGVYDNEGFRLRGHQFTDSRGEFVFETVKPSDYRNFGIHRTPHMHVKVQGRQTKLLTTQLYFPNERLNEHDWFFRKSLLVQLERTTPATFVATFNFVLQTA